MKQSFFFGVMAVTFSLAISSPVLAQEDLENTPEQNLDDGSTPVEAFAEMSPGYVPVAEEIDATAAELAEKTPITAEPTKIAITLPSKEITVDIKKAGARKALTALLENSGVKYSLSDTINNDVKVNVKAKQKKWSDVFSDVLTQAKLSYHVEQDGTLQIAPLVR